MAITGPEQLPRRPSDLGTEDWWDDQVGPIKEMHGWGVRMLFRRGAYGPQAVRVGTYEMDAARTSG